MQIWSPLIFGPQKKHLSTEQNYFVLKMMSNELFVYIMKCYWAIYIIKNMKKARQAKWLFPHKSLQLKSVTTLQLRIS